MAKKKKSEESISLTENTEAVVNKPTQGQTIIEEIAVKEPAKEKPKGKQGVLLAAFDHPMFAHYAYNLTVGIKYLCKGLEVAIVKEGGSLEQLTKDEKSIFDYIIEAKPEHTNGVHGKDWLKFKLHLNELTPFEKTLFLDVDMILTPHKNIHTLMNDLSGIAFTCANRGEGTSNKRTEWMDIAEAKIYTKEPIYDISSEFIYFEKGKVSDNIFSDAQRIYKENKMAVDNFDLAKPDEPYLSVAMAMNKVKPHLISWFPTYWQPYYFNVFKPLDYIYANHYAISFGGMINPEQIKSKINNLAAYYFTHSGVTKKPYMVQDKQKIFKNINSKRRNDR
jgi:hypothetical protein